MQYNTTFIADDQRSMKYRAVLFDFDGTLTPSHPLWLAAFRIALHSFDIDLTDAEIVRLFFYRDWAEAAEELRLPSFETLQREINNGLRIAFRDCELFPEVASLLGRCRANGLQTALVTSAPRLVLDDVMPRLGLSDLFDYVVCADDVNNFKPHPEPVHLSLAGLLREPHEAIMIGDSTVDILAGKAAGTATALFMPDLSTSYHHLESLRATEPDHIFSDHCELPDILGLR
ncbi:MAG TPA: HAD family hydrolase [Steroidobacteraceae bacterium]|nr:HAD family hydrolase [Steroidobacteraceae bacterium]